MSGQQRQYGFGWLPDVPDFRDLRFAEPAPAAVATLPPHADLRIVPHYPDVFDQGRVGSCVGNMAAFLNMFDHLKQGLPVFVPSRLFCYWNARALEHSTASDAGAMIRDGIKGMAKFGVCPETEWPYDEVKVTTKPTQLAFTDARQHKALAYTRIAHSINQMKACIASGYPFGFGFAVYESFMSDAVANTGIVPMPRKSERMLGGHAVSAVGFDDASGTFIIRNSWGLAWGDNGHFHFPYPYITDPDLCDDLWVVRSVA